MMNDILEDKIVEIEFESEELARKIVEESVLLGVKCRLKE